MTKITLQQIINAAWQKFIVEDAPPSVDGEGQCAYLRPSGARCAVGLVLPDEVAKKAEGSTLGAVVKDYPELFTESVCEMLYDDLNNFQARLHDDLQFFGNWNSTREQRADEYRKVASVYGLTLPNDGVL